MILIPATDRSVGFGLMPRAGGTENLPEEEETVTQYG
jgi:hypothetical protein